MSTMALGKKFAMFLLDLVVKQVGIVFGKNGTSLKQICFTPWRSITDMLQQPSTGVKFHMATWAVASVNI